MRPGDDPQDAAHELRVTDRRRFTSSGDFREDSGDQRAESGDPRPESAAPPEPRPASEPPGPAGGGEGARAASHGVHDLGIESVFLIFHQSALIALGATHPGGPPGHVDLAEARQAITFLKVLEQKTRGNLTEDEAAMLRDLLSEAQMAYVQVARSLAGGPA